MLIRQDSYGDLVLAVVTALAIICLTLAASLFACQKSARTTRDAAVQSDPIVQGRSPARVSAPTQRCARKPDPSDSSHSRRRVVGLASIMGVDADEVTME